MQMDTENWVRVGRPDDIPAEGSRRLFLGSQRIAIFKNREGNFFALQDSCPHAGGPLSEGIVHGNCVTCPLHNWVISLSDGEAQGADNGQVRTYAIRVEGDALMLRVPIDTQFDHSIAPVVPTDDSQSSEVQPLHDLRSA